MEKRPTDAFARLATVHVRSADVIATPATTVVRADTPRCGSCDSAQRVPGRISLFADSFEQEHRAGRPLYPQPGRLRYERSAGVPACGFEHRPGAYAFIVMDRGAFSHCS